MIRFSYQNDAGEHILEYRLGDRILSLDDICSDIENYDRVVVSNGIKDIFCNLVGGDKAYDYRVKLEKSEETMWGKIGNTTRNEANWIKKNCAYSYRMIKSATEMQLSEFCETCCRELKLKGYKTDYDIARFKALCSEDHYYITYLIDENGEQLAGHGWHTDGNLLCLNKSFFKMREYASSGKMYSYANSMLHWLDFKAFGKMDYEYMYMGGLGSAEHELDEDTRKIADFKRKLIKKPYRENIVYYYTEIDCKKCKMDIKAVQAYLDKSDKKKYIIYGYGNLGISARIACMRSGANVVQIVDLNVAQKNEFIDREIRPADGKTIVIVAAVRSADEIKQNCIKKGYYESEILLPFI